MEVLSFDFAIDLGNSVAFIRVNPKLNAPSPNPEPTTGDQPMGMAAPMVSGKLGDGKLLQLLLDNEQKILNFLSLFGVKVG